MKWISVNDQLPEYGSQVLVCFRANTGESRYTTCDYVNQKVCAHNDTRVPTWWVSVSGAVGLELERNTVTHWVPLPSPPPLIDELEI